MTELKDKMGFGEQVVIELRGPDGRVKQGQYIGVPWKRLVVLHLKRLLRRRQ